jgi:mono/diheme cytochrome c family protein
MRNIRTYLCSVSLLLSVAATAGNWNVPTSARNIVSPFPTNPENQKKGALIYKKTCVSCHGKDGAGDGPDQPVGYDLRSIMNPLTDGELYWKITHGVGKMPSMAGALNDDQRWLVIQHMRKMTETPSPRLVTKGNDPRQ